MDRDLQNDEKIIPFNFGLFNQIDYTMENPDDWSFNDELEMKENNLKDENCGKVKIKNTDS